MNAEEQLLTRRAVIARGTQAMIRGAAVAIAMEPLQARAKAAKADFNYREQPKDGKTCASCRLFVPTDSGKGECVLVAGEISPTGWCMAYSPRG
jgi:Zn finger protein HypA/HybF involved in hydrogenase expression